MRESADRLRLFNTRGAVRLVMDEDECSDDSSGSQSDLLQQIDELRALVSYVILVSAHQLRLVW